MFNVEKLGIGLGCATQTSDLFLLNMLTILCRLAEREIVKLAKEKEVEIQHVHRRVLEQFIRKAVHEVSWSFELAACTSAD